jgi:hypothetical protein
MDQPRSHTTPGLALRSDDTPAVFSPHPKLPPLTATLLERRHRELCEQGGYMALLQDRVLARLVSDDAMRSLVTQLRSRHAGKYVHPTILVDIWHDPDNRRQLRRVCVELLKTEQKGLTWRDYRRRLQYQVDHERQHREFLMANLLIGLAELWTRPDQSYLEKVMSVVGRAVRKRLESEWLYARGLLDHAEQRKRQARKHIWRAHTLVRQWTPDKKTLIQAVRGPLSFEFGSLGYGIAAKLVGAALDRPITKWHARHIIKYRSRQS